MLICRPKGALMSFPIKKQKNGIYTHCSYEDYEICVPIFGNIYYFGNWGIKSNILMMSGWGDDHYLVSLTKECFNAYFEVEEDLTYFIEENEYSRLTEKKGPNEQRVCPYGAKCDPKLWGDEMCQKCDTKGL